MGAMPDDIPTPIEKHRVMARHIGRATPSGTFIETGTAMGETAAYFAQRSDIDRVITIELDEGQYRFCARKFLFESKVRLIRGDSEYELPWILDMVDGPAIFWLDAHWNGQAMGSGGETPILAELRHIAERGYRNLVFVDDAWEFGVNPAYPTVDDCVAAIGSGAIRYDFVLERHIMVFR